jgi:uncharacterized protein (TIGR03435 family)
MKTMMRAALVAATAAVVCLYGQSAFTIADVHAVKPSANAVLRGAMPQINRFEARGATMVDLIGLAWDVPGDRVSGGPAWLDTDRFDVIAQAPAGSTREQMNAMLQALLAERFELKVHQDSRDVAGFAMTVAKGGAKMKKSAGGDDEGTCDSPPNTPNNSGAPQSGPSYSSVVCRNMTMAAFAKTLPNLAPAYFRGAAMLVDQTKLEGAWDFPLKWSARGLVAAQGADGITIFDGVEKQLGLHVEQAKIAMPVVAVDSVNEKPSPNPAGVTEKLPELPQAFEVAVIKPSEPGSTRGNFSFQNGRVAVQNIALKDLIELAWDLADNRVAGIPAFAETDRYDITAKAPAGVGADFDSLREMTQALVKDRFRIAMHSEDRPVDVFALVAAKPKLKAGNPQSRSGCHNAASTSVVVTKAVACENATLTQLAEWITGNARGYLEQREVVDGTGLTGTWDFTLNFSNVLMANGRGGQQGGEAPAASDPNGAISLFDALEKQLGLRMEKQKRPLPVTVIDHMERTPTEN